MQCPDRGLCVPLLETAASFPCRTPSPRNWQVCSRLGFGFVVEKGLAPSLMKVMAFKSVPAGLFLHLSRPSVSAGDKYTLLLWHHMYSLCTEIFYIQTICISFPFSPQSLQCGFSLRLHVCRYDVKGRVSYMKRKRKRSSLHSSTHDVLYLGRSHFVRVLGTLVLLPFGIHFSSWVRTSCWQLCLS